jgi:hypothetical protein
MMKMDYLTHYYHTDQEPFRSLSALPDEAALQIMQSLVDDSPYGERFKHPRQYLADRRAAEKWVREGFILKGGKPQAQYPIAMVLGSSQWLCKFAPQPEKHGEIRLPLSLFSKYEVSFTYPDSMISHWLGRDQPPEFYLPDLHGIIFTLDEILAIVAERGMPEGRWQTHLPEHLAPYIEAQVWNHTKLREFRMSQSG